MTGHTPWREIKHKRPTINQLVHESNLIENFDDPVMDACGVAAWHWLRDYEYITSEIVLQLHRVVTAAQRDLNDHERGAWRRRSVWIDGREGADWDLVPDLMDEWCDDLWALLRRSNEGVRETHVAFERIHPFVDGNGRTGRLLMWWHEHKLARHLTPIWFEERYDYYRWFREL